MPNSIKIDFPEFSVTGQDAIVCFVRINTSHANIGVSDNKQLIWF